MRFSSLEKKLVCNVDGWKYLIKKGFNVVMLKKIDLCDWLKYLKGLWSLMLLPTGVRFFPVEFLTYLDEHRSIDT